MTMVDIGLIVVALGFVPAIWRMVIGPTDADRATAGDFTFFLFVAAAALLGVRLETRMFFDVVLVATLVGFLGTVVLARLVDRRDR
ncbi:monovalent cation/H+ antiporter complex subunit F [Phytoactinopolyspora mesophila]|uniref:Pesticidal protein Cry26Aa n=1 Tax=Phytoactinopolyspora mesophila TaxID=2650750 RepID=A0A7K3MDH1_9ACTN|nr:monovalent cation/H+ antiporter complex subunit F [Phytoactinopolyspora mesophila]NDL60448.1 pesticidal protein Cry26Aa [Phytoactinopolyspora mesophila]